MTYRAIPCACGHPTCPDWHVSGVADVQCVKFTKEQAEEVAAALNVMDCAGELEAKFNAGDRRVQALVAIRNRATRLGRLADLDAPAIIIETELALILESIEKWRPAEGHDWRTMHAVRAAGKEAKATAHPMQPVERLDGDRARFKANPIVRFLLDAGPYDMNKLAMMTFSAADRSQFAQLIGYSVDGFCELSYHDEVQGLAASDAADALREDKQQ